VHAGESLSLEQIRGFLKGSGEIEFEGKGRAEVYSFVSGTLQQQRYGKLSRSGKGLVRQYLEKMTGLSRAQVNRLIRQYTGKGEVKVRQYRRRRFPTAYTKEDIELLTKVDAAHDTLSGPATQKILARAFHEYGERAYERLARISVAHLYRLRKSRTYRERRTSYQATRPTQISIGERRRPAPDGRPGWIRVDTVHQGDRDGVKGVYHINAVDEVTQWQVVAAVPQISERWLLPALEDMLQQFPFRICNFHSDNGSEFINHRISHLLNKLLVEQTKSRPRHSNDNGLVESKNGAVIRKHIGYGHIAAGHADKIQSFYKQHLNPYLNFHRPCGVPEGVVNAKGKEKRVYRWYATPWEILRQLPGVAGHLKPGMTIDGLNTIASSQTDTEAAAQMQEAKRKLFAEIHRRRSA
jgi:transposase InsO family protein